ERAVLVSDSQVIHGYHLPPTLQTAEASGTVMGRTLEDAVAAYERDLLQDALKSARGNRALAARLLRTSYRVVAYKVRKLGIDWKRFLGGDTIETGEQEIGQRTHPTQTSRAHQARRDAATRSPAGKDLLDWRRHRRRRADCVRARPVRRFSLGRR